MAEETEQIVERAELNKNLRDYEEQRLEVEKLLLDDPDNDEYREIYDGLVEVINLTKELLSSTEETQPSLNPVDEVQTHPSAAITSAPEVSVPSVLPPQVAEQIRHAQQRSAIAGQAPASWAIGAKVEGKYHDGQWYPATITAVSVTGKFIALYDSYGSQEELERESIRHAVVTKEASIESYKGVHAPKRLQVGKDETVEEMPKWLEIKETDDDKTKEKKRKLQKSYKSKQRFQRMDAVQKTKADSWKKFVAGKGSKKRAGFMTGHKKESIFKVSDGGKVGVTGSGGMTEYSQRKRHEFQHQTEDYK